MVRQFRPRAYAAVVGAVALTMLAAACSTSSTSGSGSSSTGPQAVAAGFQALNPGSGSPQRGGTLNMIGISDVNYMDYDTAYYTTDIMVMRIMERGLFGWQAVPNQKNIQPAPDLATGMPVVSDNGLKQTVTIRSGVMWNSNPPRPVTTADVVRGIKRGCNPSPVAFGGMADFEATIKGLSAFCAGYPSAAGTSATALKNYVEGHNVSGITTSGNSITFTLTRPAPWLVGAMTLGAFNATPIEALNGLPGTPAVYNHMLSDGPYELTSYTPKKDIHFVRNPQWKASTDPLRKAYVNAINVDETGNQTTIYQQMSTGSAALGMSFDALVPPADNPDLLNQIKSDSHNVNLGATYSSNPYLVFNTVSPNNGNGPGQGGGTPGPLLRDRAQPAAEGLRRGPDSTPRSRTSCRRASTARRTFRPATTRTRTTRPRPSPCSRPRASPRATRCRSSSCTAATARAARRSSTTSSRQLGALGSVKVTGVPTNQSDFYGKYLYVPSSPSNPSPAYKGTWDMASAGWGPDWFGNSAVTFFNPLYSSPGGFPASGGSNFGYFSSTTVNNLINQALSQPTEAQADKIWAQADEQVMKEAAVYPITSPLQLAEHAPYVHNAVYMTQWQNFDPTNVWLTKPGSS